MTDKLEVALDELLRDGLDDFMQPGHLTGSAYEIFGLKAPEDQLRIGRELARLAVAGGWVEVGDLDHGFKPWNISVDAALQRMEPGLRSHAFSTEPIIFFWLRNTEKGMERARRARAEGRRHTSASP
ncbi:MAG: hypothetical protein ACYDBQ_06145 [Thermoplasmatota archaeon]